MHSRKLRRSLFGFAALLVVMGIGLSFAKLGYTSLLGQRSLQLSTAGASETATYKASFSYVTAGTVGSIRLQFCSNDPFVGDPCTAPSGLDVSQVTLVDQSGTNDFTVNATLSTTNEIVLSRPAATLSPLDASYTFDNAINPDAPGAYFVRIQTYATEDISGPDTDNGGLAFAINSGTSVSATVPPFLIFCTAVTIQNYNCANASGDYVDLGELSSTHASSGTSAMLVATNAEIGYGITVLGGTMTSGSNEITALAASDVSRPGTAQFGLNLRANSAPGQGSDPSGPGGGFPAPLYAQPNFFRFVSGEAVVNNAGPDNLRQYTVTYMVNVPKTQAAGIYVATMTYICLADF